MTKGRLACVAALALGVAGSGSAARAEEGAFFRDLMGQAGLIAKADPNIDYRERAPLVVPPRMELRQPGAGSSAQARGPQWPTDPEVVARRRSLAESGVPTTERERYLANGNARLTNDQLRAGHRPGAGVEEAPTYRSQGNGRDGTWVNPDTLRAPTARTAAAEAARAENGEPERKLLSEPPAGLRRTIGKPVAASSEPFSRDTSREEASPFSFLRQMAGN